MSITASDFFNIQPGDLIKINSGNTGIITRIKKGGETSKHNKKYQIDYYSIIYTVMYYWRSGQLNYITKKIEKIFPQACPCSTCVVQMMCNKIEHIPRCFNNPFNS